MKAIRTIFHGPRRRYPTAGSGFTLLELLTVLAIIALLAAVLVPATSAARVAVKRARTKVLFSQWTAAVELFRQEYGYYPVIADRAGKVDSARLVAALTGRGLDGAPVGGSEGLAGNLRRAVFYTLAESELNASRTALIDAFGNSDLACYCDEDGDGRITAAECDPCAVTSASTGLSWRPEASALDLAGGVRAGVIFYSAGSGERASDLVLSWK